jgi:hypothetical protein|tara:strand:- start:92 stop:328 length:237 start_codon:yes stop_codon:yes gene_type:complete
MFKKRIIGNCQFEYITKHDNEDDAVKAIGGRFIEVKIGKLRTEFTKITKEKSDGSENSFAEAEGPTAKETRQVSGAKV